MRSLRAFSRESMGRARHRSRPRRRDPLPRPARIWKIAIESGGDPQREPKSDADLLGVSTSSWNDLEDDFAAPTRPRRPPLAGAAASSPRACNRGPFTGRLHFSTFVLEYSDHMTETSWPGKLGHQPQTLERCHAWAFRGKSGAQPTCVDLHLLPRTYWCNRNQGPFGNGNWFFLCPCRLTVPKPLILLP